MLTLNTGTSIYTGNLGLDNVTTLFIVASFISRVKLYENGDSFERIQLKAVVLPIILSIVAVLCHFSALIVWIVLMADILVTAFLSLSQLEHKMVLFVL